MMFRAQRRVGSAPLSPLRGAGGREGMLCPAWAELCCSWDLNPTL